MQARIYDVCPGDMKMSTERKFLAQEAKLKILPFGRQMLLKIIAHSKGDMTPLAKEQFSSRLSPLLGCPYSCGWSYTHHIQPAITGLSELKKKDIKLGGQYNGRVWEEFEGEEWGWI